VRNLHLEGLLRRALKCLPPAAKDVAYTSEAVVYTAAEWQAIDDLRRDINDALTGRE
jgi:hypothetical protein